MEYCEHFARGWDLTVFLASERSSKDIVTFLHCNQISDINKKYRLASLEIDGALGEATARQPNEPLTNCAPYLIRRNTPCAIRHSNDASQPLRIAYRFRLVRRLGHSSRRL